MKKAVGAALLHCRDLPDDTRHKFCPTNDDTWCKWQKDKIDKTKTYRHKVCLSTAIKELI